MGICSNWEKKNGKEIRYLLFGGGEKATEHLNLSSTVFFLRPLDFVLGVDINSPTLEVFVITTSVSAA